MTSRALLSLAIVWLVLGRTQGDAYPCFAAERLSRYERRFFAFVPSNVQSDPPIECTFVFGGPPGSRLRMAAYDVQTTDYVAGEECRGDALRLYDVGPRGLQLMATYCGLLRQGQMLTMTANMAVVTFTSDSNALDNAFSLMVDAVERNVPQRIPCRNPVTETNRETSMPHENATFVTVTTTTQIPAYISTAEYSVENLSPSESAGKEGVTSTPEPEENQDLEMLTATTSRNFTTSESESKESESEETATEFITPEEMVGDESQLDY